MYGFLIVNTSLASSNISIRVTFLSGCVMIIAHRCAINHTYFPLISIGNCVHNTIPDTSLSKVQPAFGKLFKSYSVLANQPTAQSNEILKYAVIQKTFDIKGEVPGGGGRSSSIIRY